MTCVIIKHPDGELLNYINNFSPVEWWHFGRRYSVKADGKGTLVKSFRPQHFSFRQEVEDDKFIEKLQGILKGYRGLVSWTLIGHKRDGLPGTNWVITPVRVKLAEKQAREENMAVSKFLALHDPHLSEEEYNDVEELTACVKTNCSSK